MAFKVTSGTAVFGFGTRECALIEADRLEGDVMLISVHNRGAGFADLAPLPASYLVWPTAQSCPCCGHQRRGEPDADTEPT